MAVPIAGCDATPALKAVGAMVVDLYPTHYEALEHPETWCVFRAAKDGSYWHCRRDGARSSGGSFMVAEFVGDAGSASVRRHGIGVWAVECEKSDMATGRESRHVASAVSLAEGIGLACAHLGLRCPDVDALPAHAEPSPPACNLHSMTPIEACGRPCRCGHRCSEHDLHGCKACKAAGRSCHGPHEIDEGGPPSPEPPEGWNPYFAEYARVHGMSAGEMDAHNQRSWHRAYGFTTWLRSRWSAWDRLHPAIVGGRAMSLEGRLLGADDYASFAAYLTELAPSEKPDCPMCREGH